MPLPASDEPDAPRLTPAVLWVIALTVAVHLVRVTVQADLPLWLGFRAAGFGGDAQGGGEGARWWTALTYMFVHAGLWPLVFNLYVLWAFGPRLERAWSTRSFAGYYLWCGLGAVVTHALLVRDGGLLVGASGAVYGVLLAYAFQWPNEERYLFGVVPMRVKWMAAMFVAIDLVAGLSGGTTVVSAAAAEGGAAAATVGSAHWAHLGGAFFGLLYALLPSAPNVDRLRQRVASAPDLGDEPPRPVPRSLPRPRERGSDADEVVEKSKAVTARPARPVPVQPPPQPPRRAVPAASAPRSEALDHVLDKISQHGLDSLTTDERRLLEEMSRKLRDS